MKKINQSDRLPGARPEPGGESQFEQGDEHSLLVRRTLRSGQNITYRGNVIIVGDVNPGAEVIAGGHIVIMGTCRGMVHAGAWGEERSTVTAWQLQPTQLRISGHITRPPDGESNESQQPEMARIKDGMVTIEKFQTPANGTGI